MQAAPKSSCRIQRALGRMEKETLSTLGPPTRTPPSSDAVCPRTRKVHQRRVQGRQRTLRNVAKRPVPVATSSMRVPAPSAARPAMKARSGTSVWRCMASWRPRNSVSVDTSYTRALRSDSHPSVCTVQPHATLSLSSLLCSTSSSPKHECGCQHMKWDWQHRDSNSVLALSQQ